jgi:hypothetical protein
MNQKKSSFASKKMMKVAAKKIGKTFAGFNGKQIKF